MDDWLLILLMIPVTWFFLKLTYQICNLTYIWVKFKLGEIEEKTRWLKK